METQKSIQEIREGYKKRYLKRKEDPEFRKKENERRRLSYRKNLARSRRRKREDYKKNKDKYNELKRIKWIKNEQYRIKENAKRLEWSKQNRERQNAINRKNYARNKERTRPRIYENRRKRNPTYGMQKLVYKLKQNNIGFNEFIAEYDKRINELNEKLEPTFGK